MLTFEGNLDGKKVSIEGTLKPGSCRARRITNDMVKLVRL